MSNSPDDIVKATASEITSIPLPQRLGASHYQQNLLLKTLRSVEQGLRARLRSIHHDACNVLHIYANLFPDSQQALPMYGNARAGSWYVPPVVNGVATKTCSFKSADGHYGQWSSSLRRPNIHVLQDSLVKGGAVLVDVTRRGKRWPDSFAKTVPIWCAVINIIAGLVKCRCEQKAVTCDTGKVCRECTPLHLHPDVPGSEREQILVRLPRWVEDWKRFHVSLDQVIPAFSDVRSTTKPLRPLWVSCDSRTWEKGLPLKDLAFTPIICVSACRVVSAGDRSFLEPKMNCETICGVTFAKFETGFPYVQGAGDDEEAWSLGLSPAMMWEHIDALTTITDMPSQGYTAGQVEEALKCKIENIIAAKLAPQTKMQQEIGSSVLNVPVWNSRVFLACAQGESVYRIAKQATVNFDTVIVLGAQRPALKETEEQAPTAKVRAPFETVEAWFSLQDRKGKMDRKYAFGRALGPCLSLLRTCCVDRKKEALVCCATRDGDWSAGLAIAWVAWHCKLVSSEPDGTEMASGSDKQSCGYTVIEERRTQIREISKTHIQGAMLHFLSAYPQFQLSRPTLKQLNRFFSSPNPSSSISEE